MSELQHVTRLSPPELAKAEEAKKRFEPTITNTPDIPAIDWSAIGKQAPKQLTTPAGELPAADAVVITWASAEWAALEHVFCTSGTAMPYSKHLSGTWPGWEKYDKDLPQHTDATWNYWGYYKLVEINKSKVLLFKSNTHLDWPGEAFLTDIINRIISVVKPKLILSAGTAGGAQTTDHIGTVSVVRGGTLYEANEPQSKWPDYSNGWKANWGIVGEAAFKKLLFPIPTTEKDLESLASQFNSFYGTSFPLSQLNPGNLNMGDPVPVLHDQTTGTTSLLTTNTFVVATTAGNLAQFGSVEMDDAIIARTCKAAGTEFGFIRNISDPVQNASLNSQTQGNWGGAVYTCYGFYTSYNGALVAWAVLDAQLQ
jgi:nucleoside phosphorylase